MTKLWEKDRPLGREMELFLAQDDHILDARLVPYDCAASMAHARMLRHKRLITQNEMTKLLRGLKEIAGKARKGRFRIRPGDEDCHTAIENFLTRKYGTAGKKIHTARSRNDQVLTALRLYEKDELGAIGRLLDTYAAALSRVIKRDGRVEFPGYTHMRRAMPSSIGLWLGAFRDSRADNGKLLKTCADIIDQSPLGTAAGFGVPLLNIDRAMTARLMGFSRVQKNPVYAQMSRGKFEASIMHLCSTILFDLNKLASDILLFSMDEFGFISLPRELCTGSSIMPQKKNPDILELVRASYHVVLGEEVKVKSLIGNLISGYNRDLQLTKAPLFSALDTTKASLKAVTAVLKGMKIDRRKCAGALSDELFATREAYTLVKKEGTPFRDAYRIVARKYLKKS